LSEKAARLGGFLFYLISSPVHKNREALLLRLLCNELARDSGNALESITAEIGLEQPDSKKTAILYRTKPV